MSETEGEGPPRTKGGETVRVVRGRVDSLHIYELKEDELDTLAKGSPTSLYLTFSFPLLTTATSFLVTLLTTEMRSQSQETIFVVIVCVGYIVGFVLLSLWLFYRRSMSALVKHIKSRIPEG